MSSSELATRPETKRGIIKARSTSRLPTKFDPLQAKAVIETLRQAVVYANRMQKWDEGMEAAELLVKWERDFVGWWTVNIGVRKSAGTKGKGKYNAELRSIISKAKAEEATKITQQQVSRWRNALQRPGYAAAIFNLAHKKAMADKAQRRSDLQTGEMEWFTPSIYIEKARRVLGRIDLDPASSALAQQVVNASRFFTFDDDGLKQDWKGLVWLNPPYAGALIAAFAAKMLEQIACGNVTSAIMLTNAYTETSWFHNLAAPSNAVCFTRGRIKFESPYGQKCAPTNGQCFFYFGHRRQQFVTEFADVGTIMVRL